MKRLITLITILIITVHGLPAQDLVKNKIDAVSITIGEQTRITVEVTSDKKPSITFPTYKTNSYLIPGVEIIDASVPDTISTSDGLVKVSKTYTVTSFDQGIYSIPGFKVKVNGKMLQGETMAVKVITVPVDTLHPNEFFPPKGVQPPPFLWEEWQKPLIISYIIFALTLLLIYLCVRFKQNKPIIRKIKFIQKTPPHQRALNEIQTIKSNKQHHLEDLKQYYTELTEALRKYIKERFGFDAMEMTSSEIINWLHQNGNKEMIEELKSIFVTADLVKFAKHRTQISEDDQNLIDAIKYINTTKEEKQPTIEAIVPEIKEEEKAQNKNRKILQLVITATIAAICILTGWMAYQMYLIWE